ncbi:MAG TPA: hypothetical protein ENK63_05195 [Rhodobacterales bacterium]|nr:hypothetical protein [Rhodobacterales bacterium]
MLVISLTTIPPRYGQLPQVLTALLGQGADRVALVVPRRFARVLPAPLPPLPQGVEVLETEADLGPAGKLLAPARAFPGADILYCDDDWLYAPGWAAALRSAHRPGQVTAASTWKSERIGRKGGPIAQGFGGVLVSANLARQIPAPPPEAWAVDDIWLSGYFAALGLAIRSVPGARTLMTPLASPAALQDHTPRDGANRRAAEIVHRRFGIWPPI